jgi:hypothetical protein
MFGCMLLYVLINMYTSMCDRVVFKIINLVTVLFCIVLTSRYVYDYISK